MLTGKFSLSGADLYVLTALNLTIAVGALAAAEFLGVSASWAILGAGIILFQASVFFRFRPRFFQAAFLSLFAHTTASMSCAVIELGAYLSEVNDYGVPTGATLRLCLLLLVFFLGSTIAFDAFPLSTPRVRNGKRGYPVSLKAIILLGQASLVGYLLVVTYRYGSPLVLGMNRYEYWGTVAPAGSQYVASLVPQMSFLLGLTYAKSSHDQKAFRSSVMLAYLGALVALILQGDKFSLLLQTTFFFFVPTIILSENVSRRLLSVNGWKLAALGMALTVGFFALILFNLSSIYGGWEAGLEELKGRVALQGQVWWAADLRLINWYPLELVDLLKALFGIGENGLSGLSYLAAQILPPDTFHLYETKGVPLTMGFPGIALTAGGWVFGSVIVFACGLSMGLSVRILCFGITSSNMLVAIASVKIFVATHLAFTAGQVELLFSMKFLLFLMLLYIGAKTERVLARERRSSSRMAPVAAMPGRGR